MLVFACFPFVYPVFKMSSNYANLDDSPQVFMTPAPLDGLPQLHQPPLPFRASLPLPMDTAKVTEDDRLTAGLAAAATATAAAEVDVQDDLSSIRKPGIASGPFGPEESKAQSIVEHYGIDELLASLLSLGEYADGLYNEGEEVAFLKHARFYNRSLRKLGLTRDTLVETLKAQKSAIRPLLLAYLSRVDKELGKLERYNIVDENKCVAAPRVWVDPEESGESVVGDLGLIDGKQVQIAPTTSQYTKVKQVQSAQEYHSTDRRDVIVGNGALRDNDALQKKKEELEAAFFNRRENAGPKTGFEAPENKGQAVKTSRLGPWNEDPSPSDSEEKTAILEKKMAVLERQNRSVMEMLEAQRKEFAALMERLTVGDKGDQEEKAKPTSGPAKDKFRLTAPGTTAKSMAPERGPTADIHTNGTIDPLTLPPRTRVDPPAPILPDTTGINKDLAAVLNAMQLQGAQFQSVIQAQMDDKSRQMDGYLSLLQGNEQKSAARAVEKLRPKVPFDGTSENKIVCEKALMDFELGVQQDPFANDRTKLREFGYHVSGTARSMIEVHLVRTKDAKQALQDAIDEVRSLYGLSDRGAHELLDDLLKANPVPKGNYLKHVELMSLMQTVQTLAKNHDAEQDLERPKVLDTFVRNAVPHWLEKWVEYTETKPRSFPNLMTFFKLHVARLKRLSSLEEPKRSEPNVESANVYDNGINEVVADEMYLEHLNSEMEKTCQSLQSEKQGSEPDDQDYDQHYDEDSQQQQPLQQQQQCGGWSSRGNRGGRGRGGSHGRGGSQQGGGSLPRVEPQGCDYCQEDTHKFEFCPKYLGLSNDEARALVVRTKRKCFRCLSSTHTDRRCPSLQTCQKCDGTHHTSICTGIAIIGGAMCPRGPMEEPSV